MNYSNAIFLGILLVAVLALIKRSVHRRRYGENGHEQKQRRMRRAASARYLANFLNNTVSTTVAALVAVLVLRQNVPGLSGEKAPQGRTLLQMLGVEGLGPVIFTIGICLVVFSWGQVLTIAAELEEKAIQDWTLRQSADRAMQLPWFFAAVVV